MNITFFAHDESETIEAGEKFAKQLHAQDVVFLRGDLGSGKTTFTKGIAKGLGVKTRVISPTFVVVRTHDAMAQGDIQKLYHLDLYRLDNEAQAKGVDLKDILDDKNGVVVIEWPDVGQSLVKGKIWMVTFEIIDEGRNITISYE